MRDKNPHDSILSSNWLGITTVTSHLDFEGVERCSASSAYDCRIRTRRVLLLSSILWIFFSESFSARAKDLWTRESTQDAVPPLVHMETAELIT
jgi:hypothetical protein